MIRFKDFSFTYEGDKKPVLDSINIEIKTGDCIILTGLSGCGKTTLIRVINGLCPSVFTGKATGTFETEFYDYNNSYAGFDSQYVGSILQNPKSSFLFTRADDECKYSAKCIGKSKEKIEFKFKALKNRYCELLTHKNILNLSSGEAQTLSISSSCIKSPQIVVMDEPTANLDISEIDELKKHINYLKKDNVTIVIAEHRVGYLRDVCDRVCVMKDGTLIEDGQFQTRGEVIKFPTKNKLDAKRQYEILKIENLNYQIKDKEILRNMNLSIKSNTVTAIVGKNGSGKSTLGKFITGLDDSNYSAFYMNDNTISKKKRNNISYFSLQDAYHQMVTSSVKDEIFLQNDKLTESEIEYVLNMVDLKGLSNKHPSKLSGGQVLRLGVLLAYISNKKIVVLDEPTSGLDLENMELVCSLIKRMRDEGRFVIMISHDLELISKVADEYILIDNGVVVEHRELDTKNDFNEMVTKIKRKGSINSRIVKNDRKEVFSSLNPIVNLIVFSTIANAVFFYPSGQSSIYLMVLVSIILVMNKNYNHTIKMLFKYFLINKMKVLFPPYYQSFIEIFMLRGMVCGYTLKNLTTNTKLITIIEALEEIRLTDYIIIPIISLTRLFPMMRYDISIAYMSLKTRKLIKNKNPVSIWKFIIVPIVFSLIRSAENLSLGIETKGMIINKKRTSLTEVKVKKRDYCVSLVYIALYTFIIIGGLKWITN